MQKFQYFSPEKNPLVFREKYCERLIKIVIHIDGAVAAVQKTEWDLRIL